MQELLFTLSKIQIKYNPKIPALQRPRITNSQDANNQLGGLLLGERQLNMGEESAVLFPGRGTRVIGGYMVSSGGLTGTVMDIRLILAVALKCLYSAQRSTEIVRQMTTRSLYSYGRVALRSISKPDNILANFTYGYILGNDALGIYLGDRV